jgi:hypothetical protein
MSAGCVSDTSAPAELTALKEYRKEALIGENRMRGCAGVGRFDEAIGENHQIENAGDDGDDVPSARDSGASHALGIVQTARTNGLLGSANLMSTGPIPQIAMTTGSGSPRRTPS